MEGMTTPSIRRRTLGTDSALEVSALGDAVVGERYADMSSVVR